MLNPEIPVLAVWPMQLGIDSEGENSCVFLHNGTGNKVARNGQGGNGATTESASGWRKYKLCLLLCQGGITADGICRREEKVISEDTVSAANGRCAIAERIPHETNPGLRRKSMRGIERPSRSGRHMKDHGRRTAESRQRRSGQQVVSFVWGPVKLPA